MRDGLFHLKRNYPKFLLFLLNDIRRHFFVIIHRGPLVGPNQEDNEARYLSPMGPDETQIASVKKSSATHSKKGTRTGIDFSIPNGGSNIGISSPSLRCVFQEPFRWLLVMSYTLESHFEYLKVTKLPLLPIFKFQCVVSRLPVTPNW